MQCLKIRDYAMHANWDKLSPEDVNSMIGFVEQFFTYFIFSKMQLIITFIDKLCQFREIKNRLLWR